MAWLGFRWRQLVVRSDGSNRSFLIHVWLGREPFAVTNIKCSCSGAFRRNEYKKLHFNAVPNNSVWMPLESFLLPIIWLGDLSPGRLSLPIFFTRRIVWKLRSGRRGLRRRRREFSCLLRVALR